VSRTTTPSIQLVSDVSTEDDIFSKITWRLVPFLFLCYLAAYLDRVNVGFAKLQMQKELALSETVYGLGAGIFFLGYVLFEVPSNIILRKVGGLFLHRERHLYRQLLDPYHHQTNRRYRSLQDRSADSHSLPCRRGVNDYGLRSRRPR
jgi:hypothetical protein